MVLEATLSKIETVQNEGGDKPKAERRGPRLDTGRVHNTI